MIAFRLMWWVVTVCFLLCCGGKAVSTPDRDDGSAMGETGGPGGPPDAQVPGDAAHLPGTPVAECRPGIQGASKVTGLHLIESWEAVSWALLTTEHYIDVVLEQQGEPCDGAVGTTCLLDGDDRKTGFYLAGSNVAQALIVSRDGEHEALGYRRLREVLGPIDTANEAAVIAWSEGWDVSCSDMREDDGGYWIPDSEGCVSGGDWVRILRDGSVSQSAHCSSR